MTSRPTDYEDGELLDQATLAAFKREPEPGERIDIRTTSWHLAQLG